MLVLALDTATSDVVTGLVDTTTGQSWDRVIENSRGHNESLMPAITSLLDDASVNFADLEAVVVGSGPGPFTGLRVGMATAQALGQALGIEVYGVLSHQAMAARYLRETGGDFSGSVMVASDARRKEIYCACFAGADLLWGPEVLKPAALELPDDCTHLIIPPHLSEQVAGEVGRSWVTPRAVDLVAVAEERMLAPGAPAPLRPAYLRRPDAVEPAAVPRSPAIPEVEL